MIDAGLLVIRLALGLVLAGHGAQKLFGWWGGGGLAGTARMFGSLGFRPPRLAALFGGLAEFAGGLLVAVGLVTPLGCLAVIVMMIGAIVAVHARNGWWNTGGGIEFPALVAATAFGLVLTGPGADSVDATLALTTGGGWWAVGVLVAAAVAATVIVVLVRSRPAPAPSRAPVPTARERSTSR